MTGLDTNVLVRYLTQDDPAQARKATAQIVATIDQGETLFIPSIVMCELVWVLDKAYGFARPEIVAALEQLLRTSQFTFDNKDLLWAALGDYRALRGDFSDYLIGRMAHKASGTHTLTFDLALKASPLFHVL